MKHYVVEVCYDPDTPLARWPWVAKVFVDHHLKALKVFPSERAAKRFARKVLAKPVPETLCSTYTAENLP